MYCHAPVEFANPSRSVSNIATTIYEMISDFEENKLIRMVKSIRSIETNNVFDQKSVMESVANTTQTNLYMNM